MSSIAQLSVIMPVFNAQIYLGQAIESILSQSFSDFELIVIDDGSTDQSLSIINSFKDSRIIVIKQPHLGLIEALNAGVKYAQSEWIARHDADDRSFCSRFEKQIACLKNNPKVAAVGTFVEQINERGCRIKIYQTPFKPKEIQQNLWVDNPLCHGSIMMRRSHLLEVGGYRHKLDWVEDYDLWFRLSERFFLANIPEALYQVRIHPFSVCQQNRFEINRRYEWVRQLAKKRIEIGDDGLAQMTLSQIDHTLESISPKKMFNSNKMNAWNYFYLAKVNYVAGDYALSAQWLKKAISANRWEMTQLGFALKLYIRSAINENLICRLP